MDAGQTSLEQRLDKLGTGNNVRNAKLAQDLAPAARDTEALEAPLVSRVPACQGADNERSDTTDLTQRCPIIDWASVEYFSTFSEKATSRASGSRS